MGCVPCQRWSRWVIFRFAIKLWKYLALWIRTWFVIIIHVELCDVKLWIVVISALTFVWVVCMLYFDRKTNGCIRMLPNKLSFYSILSACYSGMPFWRWLARLSRINSVNSAVLPHSIAPWLNFAARSSIHSEQALLPTLSLRSNPRLQIQKMGHWPMLCWLWYRPILSQCHFLAIR
jgi:hypothetical protein